MASQLPHHAPHSSFTLPLREVGTFMAFLFAFSDVKRAVELLDKLQKSELVLISIQRTIQKPFGFTV